MIRRCSTTVKTLKTRSSSHTVIGVILLSRVILVAMKKLPQEKKPLLLKKEEKQTVEKREL